MKCPVCDSPYARRFASYPEFAVDECAECGFRFVDVAAPEYPADAQSRYDEPIDGVYPYQPHLARRVRDILRYHAPPGKALDIGCGKGEIPLLLADEGFDVTGLEPKRAHVRYLAAAHPGPRWLSCPVDELVARGEKFNVISLYHVLEHVAGPLPFLRQVAQLCAPGALIVIEVPNVGGLEARLKARRWHYYKVDHVCYYTADHLAALAEAMNWRVLDVKGYQHFSYPQGIWWKDGVKAALCGLGFRDVVSIFARAGT